MNEKKNLPVPFKANELTTLPNSSWPTVMATDLINLHGKSQLSCVEYVSFECMNLESHLCEKLNCSKSKIPVKDLAQLDTVVARNKKITSLKGLEHAVKLKKIDFGVNQIKSIEPIISIQNLEKIVLAKNQIQDLAGIGQLSQLTELNFRDNPLGDITPLNELNCLKKLVLTNVPIRSFEPIENLKKLELLSIGWSIESSDQIDDTNPSKLFDILSSFSQLKELHLSEEPISQSQILKLRKKLSGCLIPDNH